MSNDDFALREVGRSLCQKWWIGIGMLSYFLLFSTVGTWIPAYVAFLFGLSFGAYAVSPRSDPSGRELDFWASLYLPLGLPIFLTIWSALPVLVYTRTFTILLIGLALVLVSVALSFLRSIFREQARSARLRVFILFGPVACGLLNGIGAGMLTISSALGGSERLWLAAMMSFGISLIPAIIAIISMLLWSMEKDTPAPEPPQRAAG